MGHEHSSVRAPPRSAAVDGLEDADAGADVQRAGMPRVGDQRLVGACPAASRHCFPVGSAVDRLDDAGAARQEIDDSRVLGVERE